MNQKGFSMMELLIVVGIIAALSLVAVPTYNSYQAKARRAEGWNLLMAYFASAQSARGEFGFFPGEFVQTDFAPKGQIGYRVVAADGPQDTTLPFQDFQCVSTDAICNCVGTCLTFKTWAEGNPTFGVPSFSVGPINPNPGACSIIAGAPAAGVNNFTVHAGSVINTSAFRADTIGLNETKTQEICEDGSK